MNGVLETNYSSSQTLKTILCVSHVFPPRINPVANRLCKLLKLFQSDWRIVVVTGTKNAYLNSEASVHVAKDFYPKRLIELMNRLKLGKLVGLLLWPDKSIFWILPALIKGYQVVQQKKPSIIWVWMMPYSASLVGIGLKCLTGLPLVFSLADSPSCTDMHSSAPSWIHHWLDTWLEDFFVRQADAVVYVSQFNLEQVKKRQPIAYQSKLHLIRSGVDPIDFATSLSNLDSKLSLEIVYTGGMNGWYEFYHRLEEQTLLRKLYKTWLELGRYQRAKINYSTSSPVFLGQAIQQVIVKHPQWQNQIQLKVYGNLYPEDVVQTVLQNQKVTDVVSVSGLLPHTQAIQQIRQADLLFITLPVRLDGTYGGRISCKTYEYLMTDRPILAAVPRGENWDYLQDKPGVWLVEPTDTEAMSQIVTHIATAHFSGSPLRFDRSDIHANLSYVNLAKEYMRLFEQVCNDRKLAVKPFESMNQSIKAAASESSLGN